MAEPNRPFYQASKPQLQEYARRSANSRRSPELKKAWEQKDEIKKRVGKGEWVKDIAQEYGIKVRQVYRILDSE